MKKIVKESADSYVNESRGTRSYETPMTRDDIRKMVAKVLIKFQREGGRSISSMTNWMDINNFGDYRSNMWVKAVAETLFKRMGGVWLPINQNLNLSELTDKVMNFWHDKLS